MCKKRCLGALIVLFSFASFAHARQSDGLLQRADSLMESAAYHLATELLSSALQQYQQEGKRQEAWVLQVRLAEAQLGQGMLQEALANAERVMADAERQAPELAADAQVAAGLAQLQRGGAEAALKQFQHALGVYEETHADNHPKLAKCLGRIGLAYWALDNRQEALAYQLRALAIRKKLYGSTPHVALAASYNDIGLIYASYDPIKALDFYNKALAVYQQVYGENHPKTANGYLNISYIERQQGSYFSAMQKAKQALAVWRSLYEAPHPNEAFVLSFIGQLEAGQSRWEEAIDLQKQALAIYERHYGATHPKIADAYNLIATAHAEQANHKLALQYLQRALMANVPGFANSDFRANPTATEYYNANTLIHTLLLKAKSLEGYHYSKTLRFRDLKTAYETLLLCDELIEQQRKVRESKEDKIALGETASSLYEQAIRLCLAMAEVSSKSRFYREQAFTFSEKGKAAVLLSAISDTKAKKFANIPVSLLVRETMLKEAVTELEHRLGSLSNPEEETSLRKSLHQVQADYRSFVDSLEMQFPAYYQLKYSVATVSVTDLQTALLPGQALVSYAMAPSIGRLYAFVFTHNSFKVWDVALDEALNKHIVGFQNGITYQVRGVWEPSGYRLYEQLLGKWRLNDIQELIVVPDRILGTIPFEALPTAAPLEDMPLEKVPFLIRKNAVSYAYSATIHYQLQAKATSSGTKALLCAPIRFGNLGKAISLNDLPGTEKEVDAIAKMLRGKGFAADVYMQEAANEGVLKHERFEEYAIVHMATHGTVNQQNPERSQIFLYPEGDREDGNLFAGEIYNLKTTADLVVFSACETGLGQVTAGEGIVGLSRALLYAGARNIVVSLWSVSDNSTATLMQCFYEALLEQPAGKGYQKPLRKAKLQLIEEGFAAPYYWAPFVLIGQ